MVGFRTLLHKFGKHYWDISLFDIKIGSIRTCKICGKKQRLTANRYYKDGIINWIDL